MSTRFDGVYDRLMVSGGFLLHADRAILRAQDMKFNQFRTRRPETKAAPLVVEAYRSQIRHRVFLKNTAPSGGTMRFSEYCLPCQEASCASVPPKLPKSAPPYCW